jgi:hypothetical protein
MSCPGAFLFGNLLIVNIISEGEMGLTGKYIERG